MKSYQIYLCPFFFFWICLSTSSLLAQTPQPFGQACTTGNLFQSINGDLIEFEFGGTSTDDGQLVCPFEGIPVCQTYTDVTNPNNPVTNFNANFNALGFNNQDNFFYAMRGNNIVRLGSNCTFEDLGEPTPAAGAGCPNNYPNNGFFSATFDDMGNFYSLHNGSDVMYVIDVATNIITNCVSLQQPNGSNVPTIADIAFDYSTGDLIGIRDDRLYRINLTTGIVSNTIVTGLRNDENGSVGSIFGITDGTIVAFYNNSGNYYQVDPGTSTATFAASSNPNGNNDGASCADTNPFCPITLEVTPTVICNSDGTFTVSITTNFDPNDNMATSATPPFVVRVDGTTISSNYDGVASLNIGTFQNSNNVLLQVEEADDPNDCTDLCRDIVNLDVNNFAPTLDINASRTEFTCAQTDPITLTAIASSDDMAASFTYNWSTNENTDAITVNTPGSYSVTVTEVGGNGCEQIASIDIEDNTFPPPTISLERTGCLSNNGGETTIEVISVDDVTYLWDDGSVNSTLTVTAGGTYSVTATDVANGCEAVESINIITRPAIRCEMVQQMPATDGNSDGSLTAMASGGSGNFEYNLDGGPFQMSSTFNNLTDGEYVITIRDVNDPLCSVDCNAILPVELIRFSAKQVDQSVLLSWSTASELNNDYFEIQRSLNAKQFNPIGIVAGGGTTLETQHYTFADDTAPKDQPIYYRLRQVDMDQVFEYSAIVAITVHTKSASSISLYPNPSSDFATIAAPKPMTHIRISNISGTTIWGQSFAQNSDNQSIVLPMLSAGIYFVEVDMDLERTVVRWIVVE
ncbi:MAG: T9SS type A sorting domain-containing protein [Bacteroidota bacterium]